MRCTIRMTGHAFAFPHVSRISLGMNLCVQVIATTTLYDFPHICIFKISKSSHIYNIVDEKMCIVASSINLAIEELLMPYLVCVNDRACIGFDVLILTSSFPTTLTWNATQSFGCAKPDPSLYIRTPKNEAKGGAEQIVFRFESINIK